MEDKDFWLLRKLVSIADDGTSTHKAAAIACNDLGMFAQTHPNGRCVLPRWSCLGLLSIFLSFFVFVLRQQFT